MTKILSVKDLTVQFGSRKLFRNLSFDINSGDFLSVLGPNGSGKTTLIRSLIGELDNFGGEIQYFPDKKTVGIGYVPQFRNIDDHYPLTIKAFIALNLQKNKLPSLSSKERAQLEKVIEEVNLKSRANQRISEASGGEKQRAYLAQSLIINPGLLILDEATASIDDESKHKLMTLVNELRIKKNLAVINITHDLPQANQYSNKILQLGDESANEVSVQEVK